jgi:hypothetical protein
MFKNLLLAAAFVAAMPNANAQSSTPNAHNNYPVDHDSCLVQLKQPLNSGGYLMSRDCKKVYVLPPKAGSFTASISMNDIKLNGLCPVFAADMKSMENRSIRKLKLEEEKILIADDPRKAARVAEIEAKIKAIDEVDYAFRDKFKNVEGGKARVTVDGSVPPSLIEEFSILNFETAVTRGLRFEAAPVVGGYLTFAEHKVSGIELPDVLAMYMGGIKVKGEGNQENIYKMHSGLNGQIVFSVSKACQLHEMQKQAVASGKRLGAIELGNELVALMTPSFSYSVPVLSTFSYEATFDGRKATELYMSLEKTKTQFTLSQLANEVATADNKLAFQMNIDLGARAERFTDEQKANLIGKVTDEVRERLTNLWAEEMALLGLAEFVELPPVLTVPEPGYKDEAVGVRTICSRRKILGHTVSKRCSDQVITRRVPKDGELEQIVKRVQDIDMNLSERVELNEVYQSPGNVTF